MGAIGFKFKASRDDSELCFKGWKIQNERGSEKVYGFKNADYNRLQTYISLPDSGTYYSDKKAAKEKKKEALHVDLAKADSLEILKLPELVRALLTGSLPTETNWAGSTHWSSCMRCGDSAIVCTLP